MVIWSLRFYHNSWQSYAKNSPQWQPITSINWFWIWLIWKPKSFRILTHHEQRVSSSASGFQWKISEMNNYILTSGFFVSYFLNMFILTFSINPESGYHFSLWHGHYFETKECDRHNPREVQILFFFLPFIWFTHFNFYVLRLQILKLIFLGSYLKSVSKFKLGFLTS